MSKNIKNKLIAKAKKTWKIPKKRYIYDENI